MQPGLDAIDLTSHPVRVDRAIQAYRTLQDCNGGNTRAGKHLADWLEKAGFTPLMHDLWYEEYEDPATLAEYLAVPLDLAGQFHHANTCAPGPRAWRQASVSAGATPPASAPMAIHAAISCWSSEARPQAATAVAGSRSRRVRLGGRNAAFQPRAGI